MFHLFPKINVVSHLLSGYLADTDTTQPGQLARTKIGESCIGLYHLAISVVTELNKHSANRERNIISVH